MTVLFHLAFPCHDFEAAKIFYHEKLGCELGRESDQALIINLGNHQIVAHRVNEALPLQPSIYPRHFGLIFLEFLEYQHLIAQVEAQALTFYIPPKIRFANSLLEHHSFFLKDPSNNLLEFKYYVNHNAIFGAHHLSEVGEG